MELLMINSELDISQERKYPRKAANFNWLSLIYPLVSSITHDPIFASATIKKQ